MITIKQKTEIPLIVKKSRFLGLACRVDSEAEAQREIELRKKQYHDARHHCFAFVLQDGTMRYSDDGEPQGTAGLPMLQVIKNSGLLDVLLICTRYFGGIKLGAAGLMRAYTQSAAQTLEAAPKIELIECSTFTCHFDFATFSRVRTPLTAAGCQFDDIAYGSEVCAIISITKGHEDEFMEHIARLTFGRTVPVPSGCRQMAVDI